MLSRALLLFMTLFLGAHVWAAHDTLSTDSIESDAIKYTNQKQVGRVIPFVSLGSYEFKSANSNSNLKPTQRFGAGVLTTILNGPVVLETGLQYLPMGAHYEVIEPSGWHKTSLVDLDYVAVPIVLKKYVKPSHTGLFFKVALLPSYLLASHSEVGVQQSGFVPFNATANGSVEDRMKSTDLQGAIGIGGLFATDFTSRVFIDLTWSRSLAPVSKNSSIDIYNEGYLLSAGLSL